MKGKRILGLFLLWGGCWTCTMRREETPSASSSKEARSGTEGDKETISPADITILFPIRSTKLDSAQSTAQVVAEVSRFLVPQSSWWNKSSHQALIESILQPLEESNPVSGSVAEDIRKIPPEQWFTVGLRFEVCGFTQMVPSHWLGDLSQPQKTALCELSIRTVQQPIGFRTEQGPSGKTRNVWATDDKSLHLIFDYSGGITPEEFTQLKAFKSQLRSELQILAQGGQLSRATFKAVVQARVNQTHGELILKQQRSLKAMILKLRGASTGAALQPIRKATDDLANYLQFIRNDLSKVAELVSVAHMLATSGFKPSSENNWVFGISVPLQPNGHLLPSTWKRFPISFIHEKGEVVQGLLSPGLAEVFFDEPGSSATVDLQLFEMLEKNPDARDYVLSTSALRAAMKLEDGGLVGEMEMSPESVPSSPFKSLLDGNLDKVLDVGMSHIRTQSCVSCHLQDGLTEKVKLTPRQAQKLKGNRLPDTTILLEQSKMAATWNLRQLGYFARGPVLGSRLIRETSVQVNAFNSL